jgi:DNA polymerase-3 subunit delta
LRGVLEAGNDPIMVLGALVYRVRSILAVAGRIDPKQVGLRISGGQARHLQGARRNFGPGELTAAMRTLADADVLLKSGDVPPELVIERAVVEIATPAA